MSDERYNNPTVRRTEEETDFETAIEACGIGWFNISLVFASLFTALSVLYTTSSLSFILPILEYDLELTTMDKGYLNAVSYAGIVISALPWGYVADTIGRRIVLVYALILDGVVVICSAMSNSLITLLILKFCDGFLVCGPFAVIMSYVSEFHGLKHRARVMMIVGMNFSFAATTLPVIAILVLPHLWLVNILSLKVKSWRIFLLVTAAVPLIGGIYHIFLPESPKFLMSQGRNADALKSLRTVYSINSKKPKNEYPVTNLVDENPEKTRRLARSSYVVIAKNQFYEGLQQLKPLFESPLLLRSIHCYTMEFCILLGLNTLRLWMPQIFVTFEEFESKNMTDCDMCTVLNHINKKKTSLMLQYSEEEYSFINTSAYSGNIIVAVASFFFYLLAVIVINKIGNNMVLKISLCLGFISGLAMYFSYCHVMVIILSSVYFSGMCIAATTLTTAGVNLFPTQMRTMVLLMMMTLGRFGSLLGNILFAFSLSFNCICPFLLISGIIVVAFVLSLFLPETTHIALQ